jgi:hypothetical protein
MSWNYTVVVSRKRSPHLIDFFLHHRIVILMLCTYVMDLCVSSILLHARHWSRKYARYGR